MRQMGRDPEGWDIQVRAARKELGERHPYMTVAATKAPGAFASVIAAAVVVLGVWGAWWLVDHWNDIMNTTVTWLMPALITGSLWIAYGFAAWAAWQLFNFWFRYVIRLSAWLYATGIVTVGLSGTTIGLWVTL